MHLFLEHGTKNKEQRQIHETIEVSRSYNESLVLTPCSLFLTHPPKKNGLLSKPAYQLKLN